jgi:hypothetical protein
MPTEYLHAGVAAGQPIGVDDEAKVINGYVLAQLGPFKTGRGEFDRESLAGIVNLINASPDGVVVNYGHSENVGSSEALDAFLGRAKNARVDGDKARADLHFNPVAFLSHTGGVSRGERLMQRAKTDPGSFASSLVIAPDKQYRTDARGRRTDAPPIWRPLAIMSSDVVYVGDAVHGGILSARDPDADEDLRLRWANTKRKHLTTDGT